MKNSVLRISALAALVAVAVVAAAALVSSPAEAKGGFVACPSPPCMAPCVFGAEPTVLCKTRGGGKPTATTWACCCCGSSGTKYKPL